MEDQQSKGKEMDMHTYRNTYHATEYRSRKSPEELDAILGRIMSGTATPADMALRRRMRTALCGADDCQCGDDFGRRD